jgi:hypothetical protein
MIADDHAAAAGRRLLLTLKGGGRAIPPVTGHACFPVVVLVPMTALQRKSASIHTE